jgi:hypothetical protein
MSELQDRAEELRAIAAKCKTLNDFSAATGWNMETCRHARTVLSLDLPDAKLQAGKRTEARSVPKPQKAKPKA